MPYLLMCKKDIFKKDKLYKKSNIIKFALNKKRKSSVVFNSISLMNWLGVKN